MKSVDYTDKRGIMNTKIIRHSAKAKTTHCNKKNTAKTKKTVFSKK